MQFIGAIISTPQRDVMLCEALTVCQYTVKAVQVVDSTSHSSGLEFLVLINRILAKIYPLKARGSLNYGTPCVYTVALDLWAVVSRNRLLIRKGIRQNTFINLQKF